MAPKKDKQKEPVTNPSSQPSQPKPFRILQPSMNPVKTESPSQLVPFPGCSPIQVSNRFSSLGATVGQIRPNCQSALVASYDPFQIIPPVAQSSQSSTPLPKSSPYVPKDKSHLFIIEPIYDGISDPITIVKSYFPPNCHFLPSSPYKNLSFYRDILVKTKSVEIKPIKDRENPHIILYHSLYIHQILSQEEFNRHPYELKHLQSTHPYNYVDYIEAWYSIFLYEKVDFSHSWFINFDSKFKSPFPYWFLHWWEKHGPIANILLIEVHNLTNYFAIAKVAKYVYKDFPQVVNPPNPHLVSPVGSCSSLSIEGKSKSELQEIARQLIIQASQMNDDEDNDNSPASQSSSSCLPNPSPSKPHRWSDYEYSQDPYVAYDLNSD
ncbi:unnamed protein product [Prunus armeniaca]